MYIVAVPAHHMLVNRSLLLLCHLFLVVQSQRLQSRSSNDSDFQPEQVLTLGIDDLTATFSDDIDGFVISQIEGQTVGDFTDRLKQDSVKMLTTSETVSSFVSWPKSSNDFPAVFQVLKDKQCDNIPALTPELISVLADAIAEVWKIWDYLLPFSGTIQSQDYADDPIFVFRLVATSPRLLQSEYKDGHDFSARDLQNIYSTKEAIVRNTNEDDLLVFLGNTARLVAPPLQNLLNAKST